MGCFGFVAYPLVLPVPLLFSTGTVAYFDDIITSGATEKEHDYNLQQVQAKVTEYQIDVNAAKSNYKVPEIEFLGRIISQEGIRPADSQTAIQKCPQPTNKPQL